MNIIGLSGFAQSGKDTVAFSLKRFGFERVAFADPVREAVYAMNPIFGVDWDGGYHTVQEVVDEIGWERAKTENKEVRGFLQIMGTEVGRTVFWPDFWVDLAERRIREQGLTDVVITDVRFPNEVDWIHRKDGIVVRIDRPGTEPVNSHISDTGVSALEVDHVIRNDGTFTMLDANVQQLVWDFLPGRFKKGT